MAIAFDPYTFLTYSEQRRRTGGVGLTPEQIEQLGYGVTSAQADRVAQSKQLALQKSAQETQAAQFGQSLAARESEFGRQFGLQQQQLGMEADRIAQAKRAGTMQLAAQVPTTLATIEYMTKGAQGQPGWVGGAGEYLKGLGGGAPTTPALAGGIPATQAGLYEAYGLEAAAGSLPEYYTMGTGAEGGFSVAGGAGSTSAGTGLAGVATTGTILGSAGGAALAYQYGPGKPQTVGAVMLGQKGGAKEQKVLGGAAKGAAGGAISGAILGGSLTAWSGPGAILGVIVGAFVGAGLAYAEDESVICTELLRQGLVEPELLELECQYRHHIDEATYIGYRLWADPVVRLMKRSKSFSRFMALPGRAFLKEVAHRVEPKRPGSWLGKLLLGAGVPFCRWNFYRAVRRMEVANG